MKGKFGGLFQEVIAFGTAVCLLVLLLYSFSFFSFPINSSDAKIIKGSASPTRGTQANFEAISFGELNFVSSLKRSNQITILGSSEMNDSPFASYHFLPDSLGIPAMGFGHAYHQTFAMYCELLACESYLKNSKICILISPGWFITEGTNTEAFVEFVPPNFLFNILRNPNVTDKEKDAVGKYISKHKNDFSALTKTMSELSINADKREQSFSISLTVKKWLAKSSGNVLGKDGMVHYKSFDKTLERISKNDPFKNMAELQKLAIRKSGNNKMYVDSNYFKINLLDEKGNIRPGIVAEFNSDQNQEFDDFCLLVDLLKSRNADACFVIQTLNPYYYENMAVYDKMVEKLKMKLNKADFPYLNMYNTNKSEYIPGTLSDIMHLGDLGWMQINQFLLKTYK